MESSTEETVPPVVLMPCNSECRYAEPLEGNYSEWIWCSRPEAPVRVRRAGSDCSSFEALGSPGKIRAP